MHEIDAPSLPSLVHSHSSFSSTSEDEDAVAVPSSKPKSMSVVRIIPLGVTVELRSDSTAQSGTAKKLNSGVVQEPKSQLSSEWPRLLRSTQEKMAASNSVRTLRKKDVIVIKLLPSLEEGNDELNTVGDSYDETVAMSLSSVAETNRIHHLDEMNEINQQYEALSESRIQASLAEQTALEMQQVVDWWSGGEQDTEQEDALPSNPLVVNWLTQTGPEYQYSSSSSSPTIQQLHTIAEQRYDIYTKPHEEALEQCFLVDQIVERTREMAQLLLDQFALVEMMDDDDDEIHAISKDTVCHNCPPLLLKPYLFWSALLWKLCASVLLIKRNSQTAVLYALLSTKETPRVSVVLAVLPLLAMVALVSTY